LCEGLEPEHGEEGAIIDAFCSFFENLLVA
jgi:hypothetical protein